MALVATRCLCELLIAKTHFNFRLEIMVAVVTRMSTVKWNEAAELCSKTLITIFENDESGRSSLDAVKMIIRMVKSKGFAISENVINVFLHLRLKDEMAHNYTSHNDDDKVGQKRKNNNKPFMTKKARKTAKETKEIEKEFQEAEAVVSKEEKDKNVSRIREYAKIDSKNAYFLYLFVAHRNLKINFRILLQNFEEANLISSFTRSVGRSLTICPFDQC